ncbi:MAG: hypothetical protein E7546_05360 [Ruminococcaceae bacterium]|nr:hypothetical protein [Oscillospiraceae bacterium]
MTAKKLERMLKKAPGTSKFMAAFYVVFAILLLVILFVKFSSPENRVYVIYAAALIAIPSIIVSITIICFGKKAQTNGFKTIEYLDRNGLFEAAAAEYDSDQYYAFKCSTRDGGFDKFNSRTNFMTENFIFAMSSNQIVTYNDIKEIYIVRYLWSYDATPYVNEVFTAKTLSGEEIDLFNMFLKSSAFAQRDRSKDETHTLNTITEIIREKNPDCIVSTEILETRSN